ncbi:MAG: 4Fe-4S binding protein [Methanobrevibacter sp.]|nr:4Fe-4S binding protein [Methanobrevibacter sp.]
MISIQREGQEKRELKYNNDNCVGCGICSDVCPTSSLTLDCLLPEDNEISKTDYISMDESKCVLCGLCSFACPFNAIDFKIDNINGSNLSEYPKWSHGTNVNPDDCILCGKCELYCPRDAIFVKRNLPKLKDLVRGEQIKEVEKCITCRICEEMCPSKAITIKTKDDTGKGKFQTEAIEIDSEKCMYCKICQKVCPQSALRIICTTCMDHEEIVVPPIEGDVILDKGRCINCSWCENICPTDAIHTIKPFDGKVLLEENKKEEKVCTGKSCHLCYDICPCNAITLSDNSMTVNQDVCVLCGACEKVCPEEILTVDRTLMNLTNIKSTSWQQILKSLIE